MLFKEKIMSFFDALLHIFEGNNLYMYSIVMKYRHKLRNIVSEEILSLTLKNFLTEKILSSIRKHVLNFLPEISENFGCDVSQDIELLMNTCSLNNQKIVWKWVNSIADSVYDDNSTDEIL
jgi:hypothetical protein